MSQKKVMKLVKIVCESTLVGKCDVFEDEISPLKSRGGETVGKCDVFEDEISPLKSREWGDSGKV